MNKLLIVAGVLAVPIGFGFVCPALAEAEKLGTMPATGALLLLLGLAMMLGGAGTVGYAIRSRRNGIT